MSRDALTTVKYFTGFITAGEHRNSIPEEKLKDILGPPDYKSEAISFEATDYYESEMGKDLSRQFWSFKPLRSPGELASVKLATDAIEKELSVRGSRTVNIDPGYLDFHKLVLGSRKAGGPKVYLSNGIWADITLIYENGEFHPFRWTFPDFKTGNYDDIFSEMRLIYKNQLKS